MTCHCYLLILAVVVSLPALAVHGQEAISGGNSTVPYATIQKPFCKQRSCPRIYRPVCGAMGDQQFTVSSRCVLNNKIRCAKFSKRAQKRLPPVRYLHKGPCKNERRSVVYMRDNPSEAGDTNESLEKEESVGNEVTLKSGEFVESDESNESANNTDNVEHAEIAATAECSESAESFEGTQRAVPSK